MPLSIQNPVTGYVAFFAVKLLGYSLFARWLSRAYGQTKRSAWTIGTTRTVIGMVAGALYYGAMVLAMEFSGGAGVGVVFLAGLLPLRVAEWWLLLWMYYDRDFRSVKNWKFVALGTAWSYVLDLPAIAGFVATSDFWIC